MFDVETLRFLEDLKANNNRDWFQAQKPRYDSRLRLPAKAFCAAMEARLSERTRAVVTGKLFRFNRNLRFSKDKTPYNTHIHMGFADPVTGAAWMVGLEIDRLAIGYGIFAFDKPELERWREAVAGPPGAALAKTLTGFQGHGLRLSESELKRVPVPYDQSHPQAELLRRKGLTAWQDLPVERAFGSAAPETLAKAFAFFDPMRDWMAGTIRS